MAATKLVWTSYGTDMNEPGTMRDMLSQTRDGRMPTLAVIGLSEDSTRPSHTVSAYMQRAGYRILPVNPTAAEVLGERCYPSLRNLPEKPDVVNVFRLPRFIPGIVDEMIALNLWRLWVQLGISHTGAAETAERAGIGVVMNRCILVEHRQLTAAGSLR